MGGEEGAGSRIPKGFGKQEKKGKIMQRCAIVISQSKKCKEANANKYRAGTGIKGYGKRVV